MKEGWVVKPLADVCQLFTDGDWIESKDQSTNGIRLIQTGNVGEGFFKDRSDKARFVSVDTFTRLRCTEIFEGDVLISRLPDPVGRSCILPPVNERMITSVDCSIIRFDRSRVLPEFFNYYSQSSSYLKRISEACTGATRTRISRANLGSISIPITCIEEQQRIVAKLDEAFKAIASAKEKAEQNLLNARALFDSYLDDVFSKRGAGWIERKLVDLTEKIGSGATPLGGQNSYKADGISLIRSLNVHDEGFRYEKLAFIDAEQANGLANVTIEKNDVLLNITGASVARCCVVPIDVLPARVNQHVSIIRAKPNLISYEFLYYALTSRSHKKKLLKIGDEGGSTRQAITKAQLQEYGLSYPAELSAQKEINERVKLIREKTQALAAIYEQKINALAELKQSLLHQAFSGEL